MLDLERLGKVIDNKQKNINRVLSDVRNQIKLLEAQLKLNGGFYSDAISKELTEQDLRIWEDVKTESDEEKIVDPMEPLTVNNVFDEENTNEEPQDQEIKTQEEPEEEVEGDDEPDIINSINEPETSSEQSVQIEIKEEQKIIPEIKTKNEPKQKSDIDIDDLFHSSNKQKK